MKPMIMLFILIPTITVSFILSYVYNVSMTYWDQYLALGGAILMDGVFGIISGTKKEGFQTRKALKNVKELSVWFIVFTSLLLTEKAFPAIGWLSETIVIPVIIFMIISALKNASKAGFIRAKLLNEILEKIDTHKD